MPITTPPTTYTWGVIKKATLAFYHRIFKVGQWTMAFAKHSVRARVTYLQAQSTRFSAGAATFHHRAISTMQNPLDIATSLALTIIRKHVEVKVATSASSMIKQGGVPMLKRSTLLHLPHQQR
jgi:hypothetical protein